VNTNMMQRLAMALLVLIFAAPAHAALTTEEAAQVSALVSNVISPLNAALGEFSLAVRYQQDGPDVLRQVIEHTKEAVREAHLTLALLVNVVPSNGYVEPDPGTRATRVAEAWFHLDRVTMFAYQAIADAEGAVGENTRRGPSIWLRYAIAGVPGIDRSQAFSNPAPASFPAVVGPHGDYNRVMFELYRSNWYALDMLEYAMPYYGRKEADWYVLVSRAPIFYDGYARAMALMAGVVVWPADPTLSQFWRVLGSQAGLTDYHTQSLSLRYSEVMDALTVAPAVEFRPAYLRIVDSWKHMDQSVWETLVFVNCSATHDPDGCARGQSTRP
jgi:hypothetical protein